jgi:murein DD-endopeptidase MepM/ murein hydrolase activator NlpD
MSWFLDRMLLDGEKVDARIENNVVAGEHVRTMTGASTVDLTIHDPERTLIRSGVFANVPQRRIKRKELRFPNATQTRLGEVGLVLDGDPYLLSGVNKNGSELELRFEHEIVALMRQHKKARVSSRNTYTRAEFIKYQLVGAVKKRRVATFIPSLGKKQPQREPDIPKREVNKGQLITIDGQVADAEQRKNMALVAQAIEETGAGEKASLALIEACIIEPRVSPAKAFYNPTFGDEDSVGILQLRAKYHLNGSASTKGGRRDVKLVAKLFLTKGFYNNGGAIALAAAHPNWTPGQIAQAVQGSRYPDRYETERKDAEAILDAIGGEGGTTYVTDPEGNVYTVGDLDWRPGDGEKEDYWSAATRLADEVGWNLYVANNILFYCSDRDLFKRAPVAMVAENPGDRLREVGVQYVGNIDFDLHYNKAVEEVRFKARASQFFAFPGATIEIVSMGIASGKYLIEEIRDTIGSYDVDIVCRRPARQKPEPAPPVIGVPKTDLETSPVSVREGGLVYPLPVPGTFNGGVAAHKSNPGNAGVTQWQDVNAVDINVPRGTPVFAVEDGTIVRLGGSWRGGASQYDGYRVTLQGSSNQWYYTHLMRRNPMNIGMNIRAGQTLGVSGAGNGVDHLHIACEKGDPERLLRVGRPFPTGKVKPREDYSGGAGSSKNPRGVYG